MRYELEQFGIDVILIELGVVKTNFFENIDVGVNNNTSTTNNKTSVYSQLTQKFFEGFEPMLNSSSSSSSSDVAQVIYQAIESNNRDVRYLVGKDAISIINARQNLSDEEFEKWIKENTSKRKDSYINKLI
jgi:short-subunit dehydrogenase